eukprot:RCo014890
MPRVRQVLVQRVRTDISSVSVWVCCFSVTSNGARVRTPLLNLHWFPSCSHLKVFICAFLFGYLGMADMCVCWWFPLFVIVGVFQQAAFFPPLQPSGLAPIRGYPGNEGVGVCTLALIFALFGG